MPLKSKYSIKFANQAVIIVAIFVFLNIATNCDTTNINIIILPILLLGRIMTGKLPAIMTF